MDAAFLHARAVTCRRLAQTLPRNDPGRLYLLGIADDLLATELRVRRGLSRMVGPRLYELLPNNWFCYPRTLSRS
jgi:hypothetical protein